MTELDLSFVTAARRRALGFEKRFAIDRLLWSDSAGYRRLLRYEIRCAESCDQVHVMSPADAAILGRYLHDGEHRLRVIDNGVDCARFHPRVAGAPPRRRSTRRRAAADSRAVAAAPLHGAGSAPSGRRRRAPRAARRRRAWSKRPRGGDRTPPRRRARGWRSGRYRPRLPAAPDRARPPECSDALRAGGARPRRPLQGRQGRAVARSARHAGPDARTARRRRGCAGARLR